MILALLATFVVGCTEQRRAKTSGGTATIELPRNTKLITTTWKEDSLWYLTHPMRTDEKPEQYEFIESSSFGLIEGKVLIIETE